MQHRICPICGGEKINVLNKINMNVPKDYHLPDSYHVVACEHCGFVYADTSASMEDYDWYYTHCNFYGDDSKGDNSWRYKVIEEFLDKYVSHKSVMLEIGAGNGNFELALKSHGYENITGNDPSKESVDRLLAAGILAKVGSIYIPVLEEDEEKYDCIFLFEVAEHLLMPSEGISNIKKMLKRDGIFMISVPDYSLIEQDESNIPNYFNLEHINYFSAASLDNLMAQYGMARIDQKHIGIDLIQIYRNVGKRIPFCKDQATEIAIRKYFQVQKTKGERVNHIVDELAKNQREVVIWGTGSYVMNLTAVTALLNCNVKGFVDNNKIKQGRTIYGHMIYAPEFLQDKHYTVLICSMQNSREIKTQLEAMHTENDIVIL